MRGALLLRQGKETEAQKDFDHALKLDPGIKSMIETLSQAAKPKREQ
jgi:Tfp pilus assembly protein PilF